MNLDYILPPSLLTPYNMYLLYLLCARNIYNSADCEVSRDVGIVRAFNGTLEG